MHSVLNPYSKLLKHLNALPAKNRPAISKGSLMHDTPLSSLSPRLRKPYWLLHAGNCEHFLLFEHIRYAQEMPVLCFNLTPHTTESTTHPIRLSRNTL